MRIPYILLLLFTVVSCVQDVVLDTGEMPTVVVECVLVNEPTQTLYLSFTKGALRESPPELTEAVAVLTDLTEGRMVGHFERLTDGSWNLNYEAIPSHRYHLSVEVPGYDAIEAEQTVPEGVDIHVSRIWRYEHAGLFPEPNSDYEYEQGSFYRLDYLPDFTWVYGLNYDLETGELKVAEEICTDFPDVDVFNLTGAVYQPEIRPDKEWLLGNPCDGWTLYPHLLGKDIHRRYLRFRKDHLSQKDMEREFLISGSFTGEYYGSIGGQPGPQEGRLVFASLSADYDRYLQEALVFQIRQASTDLSTIFYRDNIHSNISGGIGIFGAMTKSFISWARIESPVNPQVINKPWS